MLAVVNFNCEFSQCKQINNYLQSLAKTANKQNKQSINNLQK